MNLAVKPSTTAPGKVTLSWKRVPRAKSYLVQVASAATTERHWEMVLTSTRSRLEITGLTPLHRHAFRVRAIGGRTGHSDWSDEATKLTF